MIRPPFLQIGSKVALVSPAGAVEPSIIDGARQCLAQWGLQVVVGAHAYGKYHRFSGTDAERISDLQWAIDQPDIAAIFCCRGGYGLARIIDQIDFTALQTFPKWMVGFSDITVLHNALSVAGIASLHGGMCKLLVQNNAPAAAIHDLLFGKVPTYHIEPSPYNRMGEAQGIVTGGNLSVLYGLQGTPYQVQTQGRILLLEDLCEPLYHIDRMVQNLRLSGVLAGISGLIVGQFSDINPDTSFAEGAYGIIAEAVKDYDYPVCMGAPIGHVDENYPIIMGTPTTLTVTSTNSIIRQ